MRFFLYANLTLYFHYALLLQQLINRHVKVDRVNNKSSTTAQPPNLRAHKQNCALQERLEVFPMPLPFSSDASPFLAQRQAFTRFDAQFYRHFSQDNSIHIMSIAFHEGKKAIPQFHKKNIGSLHELTPAYSYFR